MAKLTHYRLCPQSRSVRLALAELGLEARLAEERPWDWRPQFLALNPAGELPVLELTGGPVLCGSYSIAEFLGESRRLPHPADGRGVTLFPGNAEDRAEVRRLVSWFHGKLDREVTREALHEKVTAREQSPQHTPDVGIMRAIGANLRYHMSYLCWLADQRRWLAGDELSFADLAAAAHLSVLDFLGEVPWDDHPVAKLWYARVKSRPSFRSLLADRVPGIAPPLHYTDLDF
jgi:glutathione S-transferase